MSQPSASCLASEAVPAPPCLVMTGVAKRFGRTHALRGVDLVVRPCEIHALVGENGAGKSTLMKILSGVEQPDAGRMTLAGQPYALSHPREALGQGVVMIYQELALAPHLSVEDNMVLGAEPARLGIVRRGAVRRYARTALDCLGHPGVDPSAPVRTLSTAACQIVEIARATASGCRVLVLDEPTSSLAREDVERLFTVMRRLAGQGVAIVYISHVIEEVKAVADRITVLRDGQSVLSGAPADSVGITDIITRMAGRDVGQLYPRSPRRRGEMLLSLRDLSGGARPRDVSLDVHAGEVFGIAGVVGSGRTELLRLIFGLDPVVSGRIRIAALEGAAPPHRRLEQGAGMLSEDRRHEGLATALSVADNMTLTRPLSRCGILRPAARQAAVRRRIGQLDIRCQGPAQRVSALSGGNQQKIALARLLHHDVDLFLLDEPTRGIDVASKVRLYAAIDALAAGGPEANGRPRAVLVVSSYIPELLGICDRIAVMCRGRLGRPRPVGEWTEHTILAEATGQFPDPTGLAPVVKEVELGRAQPHPTLASTGTNLRSPSYGGHARPVGGTQGEVTP